MLKIPSVQLSDGARNGMATPEIGKGCADDVDVESCWVDFYFLSGPPQVGSVFDDYVCVHSALEHLSRRLLQH
jgi:hypothetical protein